MLGKFHWILTSWSDKSNDVWLRSRIDTKAGDVYAEEKPTTIDPSDTDKAARTWKIQDDFRFSNLHFFYVLQSHETPS